MSTEGLRPEDQPSAERSIIDNMQLLALGRVGMEDLDDRFSFTDDGSPVVEIDDESFDGLLETIERTRGIEPTEVV